MNSAPGTKPELLESASLPFIGQWNQLVSQTNWEKGKIIHQWRLALIAAGAPATEYSDTAWSERVGNVTSQHVGRLRRVYERFGDQCGEYPALYWSHFQAALDWNDAEMYLEGAVQNGWSVSQMRHTRWEATGAPPELKPREEDIITAEVDEDVDGRLDRQNPARQQEASDVRGESHESFEPDFGEESSETDDRPEAGGTGASVGQVSEAAGGAETAQVRPFANLAALPDDLGEAFESFKLAILHHKLDGWREVARDDLLATLDALKELALAESVA